MAGVEIVAHRGANNLAPENSLSAARLCRDLGVDWLRVDVRTSRSGQLYSIHDARLTRTTGGAERRPIAALNSREIDALDAGRNDRTEFKRIVESGADMVNLDHVAEFKDVTDDVRRGQ
ncbi:MAG TPA: glycerophosphodiester phosphodiesterase family protein [Spirochaetia bacterium]|nr:glycerophosphodiester phosphodiesterase family protein [Spirochaetia bacterium]